MATPRLVAPSWYVVLVSKRKCGEHKLLRLYEGKVCFASRTDRALAFESEQATREFMAKFSLPRGWSGYATQIPPTPRRRKPRRRRVKTEFGPVLVYADQPILFPVMEV
jgi:hypothetical protein